MDYKSGYYWVNFKGAWLIARHHTMWWWLCGHERDYKTTDFIEIGEYIEEHEKG